MWSNWKPSHGADGFRIQNGRVRFVGITESGTTGNRLVCRESHTKLLVNIT